MQRRIGHAVVGVLTTVVVAGCGGGASSNGIEKLSASAALAKVKAALAKVSTVHVSGQISAQGEQIGIDLRDKAGAGTGTLKVGGGEIDIVRLAGTVYVKGDKQALTAFGAPAAQAAIVAGKWLKESVSSGGSFSTLADLLDTKTLFNNVTTPQGKIESGHTTTVNGQKAYTLLDSSSNGNGTLYVADTGAPLPLRLKQPGSNGGQLDFEYGGTVDVNAPSGAVDLSSVSGGG